MHFISLLLILSYSHGGLSAQVEALPNPNHIFNAIHSSMRQWGSSLNHNGMSFFLATIPQGTHLHHGRNGDDRVLGIEWLAFEPEHALKFAWRIYECDDPNATVVADESMQFSFAKHTQNVMSNTEQPQSSGSNQETINPPPPPQMCRDLGFLHTYAPRRDLNLLYIDGQSAAKSLNGTLDSQDYILRHDREKRGFFDERGRADDLCSTAATTWQGRIDGFIRMEHGFEVILCDFSAVDVVSILEAEHPASQGPSFGAEEAEQGLSFFSAIAARYDGIGGQRVRINYENFVTAFAYPHLELFETDTGFPRLNNISSKAAEEIFNDVSALVVSPPSTETVDWQAITTLLTTRYARHLQRLSTPEAFPNSTALSLSIRLLLSPYISHSHPNATNEIERCTTAFLPYHFQTTLPTSQVLAHRAFTSVSHHLCQTLHAIMTTPTLPLHTQQSLLKNLTTWLDWSDFRKCEPSCDLDEVCFTAIWPWGGIGDIERPNCRGRGDWSMNGGWFGKERGGCRGRFGKGLRYVLTLG